MNGNPQLNNTIEPWRIIVFAAVLLLAVSIYLVRLFTLQIVQAPVWLAQAAENRTREINLPTQRGVIYDRNNVILARNIPSFNVVLTFAELPDDPGAVQQIFNELSDLLDIPVNLNEISDETPYVPCLSEHGIAQIAQYGEESAPYQRVRIACDIDATVAMIIQERAVDWPGIDIETQPIRDYPTGSLTASIIGFLGPIPAIQEQEFRDLGFEPNRDKVGYAGIELQYQNMLAGTNGRRTTEVDVAGQEMRPIGETQPPVPGLNLRLTIDTRLQQAALSILVREINFWNNYLQTIRSTSGVVIAMNPTSGEILAMVSYPTYENNRMARIIPSYYYNQLAEDP
ncbi:MAG: hypothetical protein JSV61_16980, partial [Anaerolineales bacterium]